METFTDFISTIDEEQRRARVEEVFVWIGGRFPELEQRIAWNQPMYTDHGTYIIGFSLARKHMSVAPERAGMERFSEEIAQAGYTAGKELFRIPWDSPVNYSLLEKIIQFNIQDKAECTSFWRKG